MGKRYLPHGFFCVLVIALLLLSSPYLMQAASESEDGAEIQLLRIQGEIDCNYAVTDITEVLYNPNDEAIQETFIFKIPEEAMISNFSLEIDEVIYYAEVVPKEEARERYEEAASSGKNAGLMESRGTSIFAYSISLAPQETITVGLRYEEYLLKTLGSYTYHVYLGGDPLERVVDRFEVDIHINSELAITELEILNYDDVTQRQWSGEGEVTLEHVSTESQVEDDFVVIYKTEHTPKDGLLLDYFNGEEVYFFHVFSPELAEVGEPLDKDIIFVLDKSGSMSGEKITQLKEAFSEITEQLPDEDYFNIVVFDSNIDQYSDDLLRASKSEKDRARNYINEINSGGSTNIHGALMRALNMMETEENRAPIIVFLTDGLPTSGKTSRDGIRSDVRDANEQGCAIFSLGFGYDVDFDFLSALSLENDGYAQRIYEAEDAALQITHFYDMISTPLLRDLQFSYSDGTYEVHGTDVSHLFVGSETVVVGKCEEGIQLIESSVTAQSGDGEVEFNEDFPVTGDQEHSFIERYWAYRTINEILDEITVLGEDEQLISEIVDISTQYSFVTPYTSLLIEIDEEEEPEDPNGEEKIERPVDNTYPMDVYDMDDDGYYDSFGPTGGIMNEELSVSYFPMLLLALASGFIAVLAIVGTVIRRRRNKGKETEDG